MCYANLINYFHFVLANLILTKQPFILDRDKLIEYSTRNSTYLNNLSIFV